MKLSYVDKPFDPQNGLWTTYNKTIEFMVAGPKHNYTQEYIYAQEHRFYNYYYHFEGHWENKDFWKNDDKTVWIKSREHLHVERPLFLPKTG